MTGISKYCRCLGIELSRALVTPRTYIALILVALTYFLSVIVSGIGFNSGADSVYFFYRARFSHIRLLQMLCITFAFSVIFIDDWKHKYTLSCVIRSGTFAYAAARVTSCFICSWVVSFSGLHLFLGLMSLKLPFISELYSQVYAQDGPYGALVHSAAPYLYVFVTAGIVSAMLAFWAVVGLLISAFCSNVFVAAGLPVLIFYYITDFTAYIPVPKAINITNISYCGDVGMGAWGGFIYSVLFFALLSALAGFLFYKRVKARVAGEIR